MVGLGKLILGELKKKYQSIFLSRVWLSFLSIESGKNVLGFKEPHISITSFLVFVSNLKKKKSILSSRAV